MPPAFVQKNDATLFGAGSFTTANLAFPGNNTGGNLLVAVVSWFNAAVNSPNTVTVAVTDSQGNVWIPLPERHTFPSTQDEAFQFWYTLGCAAGANTVTFTFSAGASFGGAFIGEWSGVNAIDNFDNQADQTSYRGTGTSILSTNSRVAATHDTTELAIGYAQSNNYSNWTAGGGWTLRSSATSIQVGVEDQNVSNGTYAAPFTLNSSSTWGVGTVTFFQTSGAQFVQEIDHDDGVLTPRTTDVIAYAVNNGANNLLFLNYVWLGNGGNNVAITSVTDTRGNTWVPLPRLTIDATNGPGGFGPTFGQVWYALNCAAGANTVTVTFNNGGATFVGGAISEWSGVHFLDVSNQNTFSGSGSITSPSITTRVAADLILNYFQTEDGFVNWTGDAAYIARTCNHRSLWFQSKYSAAIGTYHGTAVSDGGSLSTFKIGAGMIAFSATAPPSPSAGIQVLMMLD